MRFAICLEMIFPDLPLLERARRVREAGFSAVEFWGWGGKDLDGLRGLVEAGLAVATFSGQRRGSLVDPKDWNTYREEVQVSFPVARRLQCDRLMVLTDELLPDGSARPARRDLTTADKRRQVVRGLKDLAPLAEEAGITLLLEPLNTLVDHPGYFLESAREGFAIVAEVGSPRIRLLYDVYHMQIMEGNVTATLRGHLPLVGHIHVADVPGRHEPGTGELNFANILRALADEGYPGTVGFEFSPRGDTQPALAAIAALRQDLARDGYAVH
ncbi:MAG TPA: TIM barrel protein [Candidatus Methylomirabilis sp.]|nr:TIM barrel protein [Candidatus Methylomirabilis sp.]